MLVTPSVHPVGIEITDEQWCAQIERRPDESWYESRRPDLKAWDAGDESRRLRAQPFFYSPWNETAEAHATRFAERSVEAAKRFHTDMPAAEKTRAGLAKVTTPVLVIAGEQDPGPLPAHAAELAGLFPRGTGIVPPGAHYPWVTAPRTFAETIEGFLDGQPTGSTSGCVANRGAVPAPGTSAAEEAAHRPEISPERPFAGICGIRGQ